MTDATPTVLLVVCAAPPAANVVELTGHLRDRGWDVYPVLTEAATAWVNPVSLEIATGHPIRTEPRGPQEPKSLPRAGAVIVAPATYAKAVLAAHPIFRRNLELLATAGVRFTDTDALRPIAPDGPFAWGRVLALLKTFGSSANDPHASTEEP